jgi:hypothetical protein
LYFDQQALQRGTINFRDNPKMMSGRNSMSTQLSNQCRTSLFRVIFGKPDSRADRVVFLMADSREAASSKAKSVLAALFDIDPSSIFLYNLASFVDMVESGVSDDQDLRIFEIGWNGLIVRVWAEHPLFLTDDASLLGRWAEFYDDIASSAAVEMIRRAQSGCRCAVLVLSNALLIAMTTSQMKVSAPTLVGGTKVRAPVRLRTGTCITVAIAKNDPSPALLLGCNIATLLSSKMMRLARQIYRVDAFTHPLTMPPYYQMLVEEAADDGEGKIESHLAEGLDSAFAAAHNAGWDGEIDEEPRIFMLPTPGEFRVGFVWTCPVMGRPAIVASQMPLPWFE